MTDIIQRLSNQILSRVTSGEVEDAAMEEIERLQTELAELRKAQGVPEESEGTCKELDGCPTEMAVLKRFWRETRKAQGEPVVWIAQGHLREVSNGNILNCYCSSEQDRFAEVPLYTSAPTIPEGWQPIETAPKDGTTVLVWFRQHGAMSVRWADRDGDASSPYAHWHIDDHKHGPYPVRGYLAEDTTHWMPLPVAPKPTKDAA